MSGRKSGKGMGNEKEERRVTFFPAESGEPPVSATSQKRNMNAADSSEILETRGIGTSTKRIKEIDADGSKMGNTEVPGAHKSVQANLKTTKGSHSSEHISSKFVAQDRIPAHETRNLTDTAVGVNGNVEEGRVMKFGQKFFRVFSTPEFSERLRIPPSFSQYLQNQRTGLVLLRGQSGNKWLAELASDTKGYFFRRGWKEFVIDHSIGEGSVLFFCYDEYGQFSVNIFDGMCVEKPSAFHAKPSKDFTEEIDEYDNEVGPQQENNATTKKPTLEIDTDSSMLKKCSNTTVKGKQNMPESSVGTCNVSATRQKRNKNVAYPSERLEVAGAYRSEQTSVKTVRKVQRQHAIVSQRSPVSEGQKKQALEKAEKFRSKYPSTLQVIKAATAYNSFFMIIPSEFVREHLPHTSKKLTLWDPQANPWQVEYVYLSHRSAGAFSAGWSQFSIGNNLEKFDVCIFELIAEDNIKVHVCRAQLRIAQYLHQEDPSAAIPN